MLCHVFPSIITLATEINVDHGTFNYTPPRIDNFEESLFSQDRIVERFETRFPREYYSPWQIGIWMIKRFESVRLFPYKCSARVWTIGYGHRITKKQVIQYAFTGITLEQADKWFHEDMLEARDESRKIYPDVRCYQEWACTSLIFNCGSGKLKGTKLDRYIKEERYHKVAHQLKKWIKVNGKDSRGLLKRRILEGRLWTEKLTQDEVHEIKLVVASKREKEVANPTLSPELLDVRLDLLNAVK